MQGAIQGVELLARFDMHGKRQADIGAARAGPRLDSRGIKIGIKAMHHLDQRRDQILMRTPHDLDGKVTGVGNQRFALGGIRHGNQLNSKRTLSIIRLKKPAWGTLCCANKGTVTIWRPSIETSSVPTDRSEEHTSELQSLMSTS